MMRGITITIGGTMVTTVLLALAGTLQPLKDGDDGLPSEDLRVPLTATTSKLTVIMPEVQPQPPQPSPPPKSVGAEPTPTKSDNKIARRTPCISLLEPFEKMVIWQKINPKKWGLKRLWDECPAVQEGITRKVLVDIGANHLSTSINPFRKWYPDGQSFDVYAFEPLDFYVSGGYPSCAKCNYTRGVLGAFDGFMSFRSQSRFQADAYNAQIHRTMAERPKDAIFTVPMYDIAAWFRRNIHPETDFVVVKMDIEGGEWPLTKYMKETGVWKYVDEFLFECHHEKMSDRYKPKTWQDCVDVMQDLRATEGTAAHTWYL